MPNALECRQSLTGTALDRVKALYEDITKGGDEAQLIAAMGSLSDHGADRVGPGRFELVVSDEVTTEQVFGAVQGAGGVVRELREHHRSLEEVFLVAVERAASGADA